MARQYICNKCGRAIKKEDVAMAMDTRMGYGSGYDTFNVRYELCTECADSEVRRMESEFRVSPLEECYGF